ncbi:MAG: helix-turn-helix domain-containing protein [Bacteriovoracaceae bacterium]|nr:helix-turn-helix domain-containing protein [Bacteriovoracaceae bacterium]
METELINNLIPEIIFKKEIFEYINERISIQDGRLFTIEEAAKKLNLKISKLRQAIFKKEIAYIKLGALIRFRNADIQNYIDKNVKNYVL